MVNEMRSMNADLREGMTDGLYKKVAPNRGGVVESINGTRLRNTGGEYYDMNELDPDARSLPVPAFRKLRIG